ncbi:hypothetical protein O3P69_005775 [Scylla paramamosain]|uniref:Uncharacterized protein n=1 Tax=Scylla paramamosain TaxID=85552 RepID=A0AAW0UC91_SCYPA
MKLSSHCVDPSMVTIPEEEEQDEQCEKQRGEEQEQMEVEKEPQSQDREDGEGDATATASTASPRKHARSEKSHTARVATAPEGHEQGKDHQGQEDTTQGAGNTRRSSRVRTKPLEFWNFEKVQVERQEDGEVKVIHHKQDSTMQIQTRVIDCSAVLGSQVGRGITLPEDLLRVEESTKVLSSWSPNPSPSKSPSKRRLFSPNLNYFDEPAEEESRISRISVGGKKLTVVGRVKFNDLPFIVLEKKAYRCCVAHGMHNKEKTIFISYLFLERGNIVWNSSGKMTIYVIDGLGTMQVMSEGGAVCHQLKAKHTVQCPKESKISVRKDGRCKMLRLHVCLVRGAAMLGTC